MMASGSDRAVTAIMKASAVPDSVVRCFVDRHDRIKLWFNMAFSQYYVAVMRSMQEARVTNIKPSELNYDKYAMDQYDRDIVNSIPFHKELHTHIASFIENNFDLTRALEVLDLGTGTGITAKLVRDLLPLAHIDVVDFSEQMMSGAKKKLGDKNVGYIFGDYAHIDFQKKYDVVVSVIGIHHQNADGKRKLFNKIYSLLKSGGIFIFGDLVTYRDKYDAARNNALHYHHLVERAFDETALTEWAHHHMFLNDLAPVEDQIDWLSAAGFRVQKDYLRMNTCLIFASKD